MVEEVLKFKRLDGAVAALRTIADANFAGGSQRVSLRDRLGEIGVPVQVSGARPTASCPPRHAEGLPRRSRSSAWPAPAISCTWRRRPR